jgi:hypothetical protein
MPAARARSQGIHKITSIFCITLSDERFREIAQRVADLRGRWRETDGGVGCSDWAFSAFPSRWRDDRWSLPGGLSMKRGSAGPRHDGDLIVVIAITSLCLGAFRLLSRTAAPQQR